MRELTKGQIEGKIYLFPTPVIKDRKYLIFCSDQEEADLIAGAVRAKKITHPDLISEHFMHLTYHTDKQTKIFVLNPESLKALKGSSMKKYTTPSSDSVALSYEVSGSGETALLFIHGWLGNKSWWNGQTEVFEKNYLVASMDLAGHGESGKERKTYTSQLYGSDIAAVANKLEAKNIILVGHSMSGAYVLEAAHQIPNLKALIIVDTLKDLDQTFTSEQIESFLNLYRTNFKMAVETILPQYLFVKTTPSEVKARLDREFLAQSDFATDAIEPLYRMDLQFLARKIKIPVRAINADNNPTNLEANRKYFSNYDFKLVKGTGHYPMLEDVKAFNESLKEVLESL